MVATLSQVKRCDLCLCPLETYVDATQRFVHSVHTADGCRKATLQRILSQQEMLTNALIQGDSDRAALAELGQWIGSLSRIVDCGRKWVELRVKRVADLEKLRRAFGSGERDHPLWVAEREVAEAIEAAIQHVEVRRS